MTRDDEEQTCGKGLAENSALAAKLAELLAAMAAVLEHHKTSLSRTDDSAARELEAYTRLATEFEKASDELEAIAQQMKAYRDLPMAPHDMAALMSPKTGQVFADFVKREEEMLEYFRASVERDRAMLKAIPTR